MSAFVPLLSAPGLVSAPIEPLVPPPLPPPPPPIDLEAERAQAFEDGRLQATQQAATRIAELEALLAASAMVGEGIAVARAEALKSVAADVATLVIELSRRVIGDGLTLHPDALPRIVVQSLDRLPVEDDLWIHVPAAAVAGVQAAVRPEWRERVVATEMSIGCRIQTQRASIETTLSTAMEGIEGATRAWLEGAS